MPEPRQPKPKKPKKLTKAQILAEWVRENGIVAKRESPICRQCQLDNNNPRHPYMEPQGPDDPLVTVVLDMPSQKEDSSGEFCVQGVSALIRRLMASVAETKHIPFDTDRIRWVTATRCFSRGLTVAQLKSRIGHCRHHLIEDLRLHRPKVVMPVGSAVLGALSMKSDAQIWGGRTLTYRGWPDDLVADSKYDDGHPVHGAPPDWRIKMVPVQAPHIVYATQNQYDIAKWRIDLARVMTEALSDAPPPNYSRPWFKLTHDPQEVVDAMRWLIDHPGTKLYYDTETTGLRPHAGDVVVYMMFRWFDTDGTPRAIGFPWDYAESPMRGYIPDLAPWILEAMYVSKVIGHNLQFDTQFASKFPGCDLYRLTQAMFADTMHQLYTFKQAKMSLGLDVLAYSWDKPMAGYEEDFTLLIEKYPELLHPKYGGHYAKCPPQYVDSHFKTYVMGDVEVTCNSHLGIDAAIDDGQRYKIPLASTLHRGRFRSFSPPSRRWVYDNIMRPANRVLTRMMIRGMHVDINELAAQEDLFPKHLIACRDKVRKLNPQIEAWADGQAASIEGWELDLENKKHVKTILFDILDLPVTRLTAKGRKLFPKFPDEAISRAEAKEFAAADKFTLNGLVAEHRELGLDILLEYKKVHKQYTGFVRPMRNHFYAGVDKKARKKDRHLALDHRVHTQFRLTGTAGGRLASCVSADTPLEVMTAKGKLERVAISKLNIQVVPVFIMTHAGRWKRVLWKYFKGYERTIRIKTSTGKTIKVAKKHRFLCPKKGWVQARALTVGDSIYAYPCDVNGQRHTWLGVVNSVVSTLLQDALGISRDAKTVWAKVCLAVARVTPRSCSLSRLVNDYHGGKISCASEGQQKRVPTTCGNNSEREDATISGCWPHANNDGARIKHVGILCAQEPGVLGNSTVGSGTDVYSQFSIGGDRGDRPVVARVKGILSELDKRLIHAGGVFQEGSRGLYRLDTDGQIFEKFVPGTDAQTQGGLRWIGRLVLERKPIRNVVSSRIKAAWDFVYSRVRVLWEPKSRLCHSWDKFVGRDRRGVPHADGYSRQDTAGFDPWLYRAGVYDKTSPNGSSSCCSDHPGGDYAIETIASISDGPVEEIWDLEVEDDHSYRACGFINHNSNPNLQQLPRDSVIKRMYGTRFEDGVIFHGDMSQIELRLLAAACGDTSMVKAYLDGIDLHSLTTSRVFNIPYEHFSDEHTVWLQKNGQEKKAKELSLTRKIGKCVDPSTLVSVNGRITRLEYVHGGRADDALHAVSGAVVQCPSGYEKINYFYNNGVSERVLVVSRYGIIAVSPAHKFKLKSGKMVRADALRPKDALADITPLQSASVPPVILFNPLGQDAAVDDSPFSIRVTDTLAYVLGLFYGDGSSSQSSVWITTGGTPEHFTWQDRVAESIQAAGFYADVKRTICDKTVYDRNGEAFTGTHGGVYFGSTRASDILVALGAVDSTPLRRRTLRIPDWLFNAPVATKIQFLSGLFDTDGSTNRGGAISVTTKRWEFAQDIAVLLRSFHATFSIDSTFNKKYKRWYYRISLSRASSWDYFRDTLKHEEKAARIQKKPKHRYGYGTRENVVSRIIPLAPGNVMDLNVDHTDHLYCPNGFTTSNTLNFLTGYGGGALGFQSALALQGIYIDYDVCERHLASFFDNYPALRTHIGHYKDFIRENACAVSIFGRVRDLPDVYSEDGGISSKAMRSGYNHLIQSTASDMMLVGLYIIDCLMHDRGLESCLVTTVHDSLAVDCRKHEVPQVHEICHSVLNNLPEVFTTFFGADYDTSWMLVPFEADFGLGKDYLDEQKIVGESPDWDEVFGRVFKKAA